MVTACKSPSRSKYVGGCRCTACSACNTQYMRDLRHRHTKPRHYSVRLRSR
jgi:hypothetical protein